MLFVVVLVVPPQATRFFVGTVTYLLYVLPLVLFYCTVGESEQSEHGDFLLLARTTCTDRIPYIMLVMVGATKIQMR